MNAQHPKRRTRPDGGERRVSSVRSDDFFRTPAPATSELLEREVFPGVVWECACGDGAISRVLTVAGYRVAESDLVDRGCGEPRRDFLMERALPAGVKSIVTNPPFKLFTDFALHALSLNVRKLALFGRIAGLEGVDRYERLYRVAPPSRVWVFSRRQTLWAGGVEQTGSRGTTAFAWLVWERDHRGPQIGWIA